jgi:hypothetical protein
MELIVLRVISVLYYIGYVMGFLWTTPPMFEAFTFVVSVMVALLLMYRFNLWSDYKKFTRADQEMVLFAAGFVLVSSFTEYISALKEMMKKELNRIRGDGRDPAFGFEVDAKDQLIQ